MTFLSFMRKEKIRQIWQKRKDVYGESMVPSNESIQRKSETDFSELTRLRNKRSGNKTWNLVKALFIILGFLIFLVALGYGIIGRLS